MRRSVTATMLFAASILAGCVGEVRMDLPESFVPVGQSERGLYDMRAVSADGDVLATRKISTDGKGTIEFWSKAVTNQLAEQRGYKLLKTEAVKSAGGAAGTLLTFSARRSGTPFTYMVALFIKGDSILVAEAGGKAENIKAQSAQVRKALLSVR